MPSVTESVQDYMRALFLRFILFYSILPNNPHPSLGLAAVTKCMILFFLQVCVWTGWEGGDRSTNGGWTQRTAPTSASPSPLLPRSHVSPTDGFPSYRKAEFFFLNQSSNVSPWDLYRNIFGLGRIEAKSFCKICRWGKCAQSCSCVK